MSPLPDSPHGRIFFEAVSEIFTGADGTRFTEVPDPDGNTLKVVEVAEEA